MCGTALRSCDVIFGCVDSIGERQQLETVARCYLTPYIDVGMDVHRLDEHFSISGQVALFDARGILPSLNGNYC